MDLDESIKEELKCSNCDNYLTCTPVLVKPNGDSLCGRCSPSKEEKHLVVRNNAYEKLASAINFECRYKKEGCDFTSSIIELEEHELYCVYHKFNCPVLPTGTCSWVGSRLQLKEHFKKDHGDLLLEHPCNVKPTLAKNCEKNMISPVGDNLFLIQIKYNVSSGKYWHSVRLINNPAFTKHYEYHFEIMSERGTFSKQCKVIEQEFFQIYDDPQKEIDLNSLLTLLGRFDDLNFKITVTEKENVIYCYDCKKGLLVADAKDGACVDCNKIISIDNAVGSNIKCSKNTAGCMYFDKDVNVRKHETWFCEFGEKTCTICNGNTADLFDHYFDTHRGSTYFDVMKRSNLNLDFKYSSFLISNDVIFLCLWNCSRSFLEFQVISNISKSDSNEYDCILKMINPRNNIQKKYKLQYSPSALHDWLAIIKVNSDNPIVGVVSVQEKSKYESRIDVFSRYSFELRMIKKTK